MPTEYTHKYKSRREEERGEVRVSIWVPKNKVEDLKDYASKLRGEENPDQTRQRFCACGSGKKYLECCRAKSKKPESKNIDPVSAIAAGYRLTKEEFFTAAAWEADAAIEFQRWLDSGAPGPLPSVCQKSIKAYKQPKARTGTVVDQPTAKPQPINPSKIGRNEPCPCGSKKKYKKCCGASLCKCGSGKKAELCCGRRASNTLLSRFKF